MAIVDSPWTTISDTMPQKRVISEAVTLIGPNETPLLDLIGGFDGAASKFRFQNGLSTKVEWLEDSYVPFVGTCPAGATAVATSIVIDDASIIRPGHLIKFGDEVLWVSAVVVGTNTLTVVRAWGGTVGAVIAAAAPFTVIGVAKLENDTYTSVPFTQMTNSFNYSQIYEETVSVSGSVQDIPQATYGINDPMTYHRNKSLIGLMMMVERNLHHGVRSANAGTAAAPRSFGGYRTFITTNIGTAVIALADLTLADIEAAVKPIYMNGGSSQLTMVVSPNQYTKIRGWLTADTRVIVDKSNVVLGEQLPQKIVTPWADITLLKSRFLPDTWMPILDPQHMGLLTLRDWQEEDRPKTTDGYSKSILGEFTFCLKAEKLNAIVRLS